MPWPPRSAAPCCVQVIVAIVVTLGLVWLVRPVAVRHLNPGPAAITGSDALVGHEAIVLHQVTRDGGRVRLNGGEWSARAKDPRQELPAGTRVSVIAIEGATAVVWTTMTEACCPCTARPSRRLEVRA